MPFAQQSIENRQDRPIYISVEPTPDCYELEQGERLTIIYELPARGDALEVQFINACELVIWPGEIVPEPVVLINGQPALERSWQFKHK